MELIYTGLEQVGDPKLRHKKDNQTPTTTAQHTIQIVYSGFEQINPRGFDTKNPNPQKVATISDFFA